MSSAANALLNPFENDFPDHISKTLNEDEDLVITTCCTFNASGTYLAVGCQDGVIIVYDLLTLMVARSFQAHSAEIATINWPRRSVKFGDKMKSRKGSIIITSCLENRIIVTDIDKLQIKFSLTVDSPIVGISIHSRRPDKWLITFMETKVQTEDDSDSENENLKTKKNPTVRWPMFVNARKIKDNTKLNKDTYGVTELNLGKLIRKADNFSSAQQNVFKRLSALLQKKQMKCPGVTAIFNKSGTKILVGGTGCTLFIYDTKELKLLNICVPPTARGLSPGAWVRGLHLSQNGKLLIARSTGKVFCLFDIEDEKTNSIKFKCDFQDTVNNTKWYRCAFSGDSEFVLGAASNKDRHSIYVWNILGQLMTILEGPNHRGVLRDVAWHPSRPIIASIDSIGEVHLWTKKYSENWSAFAPNFIEIEENVEHVEAEDEFDLNEPRSNKRKQVDIKDEDCVVDVETYDDNLVNVSSDDEDDIQNIFPAMQQEISKPIILPFFLPVEPHTSADNDTSKRLTEQQTNRIETDKKSE